MLRIKYRDNDFQRPFQQACEEFLSWHGRATFNHKEGAQALTNLITNVPLEEIRKSIVMGAWASYVMEDAVRRRIDYIARMHKASYKVPEVNSISQSVAGNTRYIEYFDKHTTIDVVDGFDEDDWNGETCYIDFGNYKVYCK